MPFPRQVGGLGTGRLDSHLRPFVTQLIGSVWEVAQVVWEVAQVWGRDHLGQSPTQSPCQRVPMVAPPRLPEDEVERTCSAWTLSAEGAFSSPVSEAWNLSSLSPSLLIGVPACVRLTTKFHFYLDSPSG